MKREFKFKVFAKVKDDDGCTGFLESNNGTDFFFDGGWRGVGYFMNCDNFIVQQFTGLKDRNEKEIYEGDILLSIDNFADDQPSAQFQVLWFVDRWAFQMKGDEKYGGGHNWCEVNKNCEVIGNILENSNLLK